MSDKFHLGLFILLMILGLSGCDSSKGGRRSRGGGPSGDQTPQTPQPKLIALVDTTELDPDEVEKRCSELKGLIKATCRGDTEGFKLLVDYQGPSDINEVNQYGHSPLMFAAKGGHKEIVEFILSFENLKINLEDHGRRTALFYALSESGRGEIIELLLEKEGIKVDGLDFWQDSPLMLAYLNNYFDFSKQMLEMKARFANSKVLVKAAEDGQGQYVGLYTSYNAPINQLSPEGKTALVEASKANRIEVVKILVLRGANVNIIDKLDPESPNTPLIAAARGDHYEIVEYLTREPGISINLQVGPDKLTALQWALNSNNIEIAELLRRRGAQ